MNIIKENIDELNAKLKITIKESDYKEKVETVLTDYRRKAKIDGFRPGKVPAGMIRKMYGTAVLVDEVNKILSESISNYIVNEKLNILGEPLPGEKEQNIDFEKQTEFEFLFDIGLAPEFEVALTKKDKFPYYTIKVDKKLIDSYTENYTRKFGHFKSTDNVEKTEMLKGEIIQIDTNGNIKENGFSNNDATISLELLKDDSVKKKFTNKKTGESIDFDIKKAYPNNTEIAAILGTEKEKVTDIDPLVRFTIKEISKFENAEINQELFDKAFGKDKIKSEEEFYNRIKEEIQSNLKKESDYRFALDIKEKIIDKLGLSLPEKFLKRWLLRSNEGKITPDQIEKEFDKVAEDLKWQLIKDKIIKGQDLKVTEDEVLDYAKVVTLMQFQQYGMANMPDEQLEGFAKEMLKKEEDKRRMYDKLFEDKTIAYIKENVKIDEKMVSTDNFNKLFEKK
ncbi:MAG: trigger factor [Bacteroidales bacterium]|nr:trigger factor [Bacteroidales bacterium]